MKYISILVIITTIFFSCSKIKYYDDSPIKNNSTKVLSHRGAFDEPGYQENTLESAILGLNKLDGIEVDIQISSDNTLWLGHDKEVMDCNGKERCFNLISDNFIYELNTCQNGTKHSKLEDVFEYMNESAPNKYISLDVKYPSCDDGSINDRFDKIASEIVRLVNKYELHGRVLVESSKTAFLKEIKKKSNRIELYYLAWDNFDMGLAKALENDLDGISFQYDGREILTHEHIELVHRKGLKIQLWTVNHVPVITYVYSLKPDYIQTDSLTFYNHISNF